MQDEIAVHVGNGFAELQHQAQFLFQWKRWIVAELGEWPALNELHGDIRRSLAGDPGVQKAGNVLVLQASQSIALKVELLDCGAGTQVVGNQLDGDILRKAFGSASQVDDTHAAAAKQTLQTKRT